MCVWGKNIVIIKETNTLLGGEFLLIILLSLIAVGGIVNSNSTYLRDTTVQGYLNSMDGKVLKTRKMVPIMGRASSYLEIILYVR